MQIRCEYCDFVCICYDYWIEHLASNPHQRIIKATLNQWEPDLNDRSFVVLLNGELQSTNQNICWHFASYGLVSNAYFDNNLEYCVIQLDKKEYAVTAVADKHILEKTTLFCRLKSDISSDEWEALTTPASKTFKIQHLKLMTSLKFFPDPDSQMNYLMRQITMPSEQIVLRQQFITKLTNLLRSDFPKCVLCPYEEDAIGLESIRTFILHIHFDAHGQSQQKTPVPYNSQLQSKAEIFADFEKALSSKGFFYQDFTTHPNDPVPHIKFNSSADIRCEFTFESLLPVQLSKLINFILKLDPRLPCLFRFVDYWGHYHKLIGPYCHLIPNNCLHLLLIVFLTRKRIIPSISVIQSMREDVTEINGWDASFSTDVEKIVNLISFIQPQHFQTDPTTGKPTVHSILELMVEFFKFYAHTELISQVVCPLTGELLPKSIFIPENESHLPKSLDVYKYWARSQPLEQRFNTNSPLCVQHPFDLSCNVSAATEENVLFNFQFLCADTSEILQNILSKEELSLTNIFVPDAPIANTLPEAERLAKKINMRKAQKLKRVWDHETRNEAKELQKTTDSVNDETDQTKKHLPCYRCNKRGHFASECTEPRDNHWAKLRRKKHNEARDRRIEFLNRSKAKEPVQLNHSASSVTEEKKQGPCYRCNKPGHFASECAQPRDNGWARLIRKQFNETRERNADRKKSIAKKEPRQSGDSALSMLPEEDIKPGPFNPCDDPDVYTGVQPRNVKLEKRRRNEMRRAARERYKAAVESRRWHQDCQDISSASD